jgi:hypothetical protein
MERWSAAWDRDQISLSPLKCLRLEMGRMAIPSGKTVGSSRLEPRLPITWV